MSGGSEINITIRAKDETGSGLKALEHGLDGAGGKVKGLGRDVEDLAGEQRSGHGDARTYAKGLEGAGEKADVAEQRIMGIKDTIDGASAVMKGPGADGIGAYLQGWADLASGLSNAVLPALSGLSVSTVRSAASTVASTVAQKAAAAATKTWAAVQWVMNAALSANPIGLVVVAIAALIAGIVLAYKHSDTFRHIVQAAGRAAAAAFAFVLDKVQDFIGWVRGNFPRLLSILTGPFGLAVRAIVRHRDSIVSTLAAIGKRIGGALAGVYDAMTWPFRTAIDAITGWINGVMGRIGSMVSTIGGALGHIPGFAHGGITGAATGGPRGRTTLVGEHGPELVDLAPGSMVRSNPDTMRMLSGAGGPSGMIHIVLQIGDRVLGDLIVDPLRKVVRTQGGDVQAVLGSWG